MLHLVAKSGIMSSSAMSISRTGFGNTSLSIPSERSLPCFRVGRVVIWHAN